MKSVNILINPLLVIAGYKKYVPLEKAATAAELLARFLVRMDLEIDDVRIMPMRFAKTDQKKKQLKRQSLKVKYVSVMGCFKWVFEPTCAHARWALMSRLPSVRPSVRLSVCD